MNKNQLLLISLSLIIISSCIFKSKDVSEGIDINEPSLELSNTITSIDGTFSISFPGETVYDLDTIDVDGYDVPIGTYIHEIDINTVYFISISNYDTLLFDFVFDNPKLSLKNAMQGFTNEIGAKVDSHKEIKYKNYEGIEYTAIGNQLWSIGQNYIIDNKLFQIGILSTLKEINMIDANAFFDSFKLLEK